jgi:hypothetical protein
METLGVSFMSIFFPNLMEELVPGKSAAGFEIGESLCSVQKRIGLVEWYEKNSMLSERLASNNDE